MKKWEKEKENLRKAIFDDRKPYEEIGRHYGCSGTNIKKVAIKLGFNLERRRKVNACETFNKGRTKKVKKYCLNCGKELKQGFGKNYKHKFCCNKCQQELRHKEKYEDFLKHPSDYNRASYSPTPFKNDIIREQGEKCAICGINEEWNGKKLVFILDHIDGHASNNKRENLRAICPNCDSQLDTYKSKNKCGERTYRRKYGNKMPL